MKKIVVFSLLVLLIVNIYAQSGEKFEYLPTGFNSYLVNPKFDKSKGEGDLGLVIFTDENYGSSLFYNPIKDIFPEAKLKSIHLSSGFTIIFDNKGNIINVRFNIDTRDTALISEDDLYNLYSTFKKIKIDMSKVKPHPQWISSNQEEFDYAEIVGSFLPLEYRKRDK